MLEGDGDDDDTYDQSGGLDDARYREDSMPRHNPDDDTYDDGFMTSGDYDFTVKASSNHQRIDSNF